MFTLSSASRSSLGELLGIIFGPKVHEVEARLLVQHMTVQGRHFDPVVAKHPKHGIHLFGQQNEVASDGCLVAAGQLEIDRDG